MAFQIGFRFFVYFLIAPIIFIVGIVGNTLGIFILLRKKLEKIGPRNMYIYLLVSDWIFLLFMVINYFTYGFEMDITILSKYICKIYWYLNYFLAPVSPWILIYISVDKVISIKYPSKRFFLRKTTNQFIYLLVIIVYNSFFYVPVSYYFNIIKTYSNETNRTITTCDYIDAEKRQLINYMDTGNRIILPVLIITICSITLFVSIIRIRVRIMENFRHNNHENIKKDIRLVFSLILLNTVFVLLNVPNAVFIYFSFSDFEFVFTLYIFYSTYACNFYIILFTNTLFRKELFQMLNIKF